MFADLPQSLQEKVREHLLDNNFPAAKDLYDEYHRTQSNPQYTNKDERTSNNSAEILDYNRANGKIK